MEVQVLLKFGIFPFLVLTTWKFGHLIDYTSLLLTHKFVFHFSVSCLLTNANANATATATASFNFLVLSILNFPKIGLFILEIHIHNAHGLVFYFIFIGKTSI